MLTWTRGTDHPSVAVFRLWIEADFPLGDATLAMWIWELQRDWTMVEMRDWLHGGGTRAVCADNLGLPMPMV